ncbi:MAG: cobalamin biosynthesis protein [Planctomycetota bacterium]
MTTAVLALSDAGARLADRLRTALDGCETHLHASVDPAFAGARFDRVTERTAELFDRVTGLVYVLPMGVAVRAVAPHLRHKTTDPAVVGVDVGGRWAVSLVSGHEGGANDLALAVANCLGAEPVISTTTEAAKTILAGVGCRRGIGAEAVIAAVDAALDAADLDRSAVRLLASVDLKRDEAGLLEAAARMGLPLRFVPADEIRGCARAFAPTPAAARHLDLPAVAEPAALLAGRRTTLRLPKQVRDGVTVALAQEDCTLSGLGPATP